MVLIPDPRNYGHCSTSTVIYLAAHLHLRPEEVSTPSHLPISPPSLFWPPCIVTLISNGSGTEAEIETREVQQPQPDANTPRPLLQPQHCYQRVQAQAPHHSSKPLLNSACPAILAALCFTHPSALAAL